MAGPFSKPTRTTSPSAETKFGAVKAAEPIQPSLMELLTHQGWEYCNGESGRLICQIPGLYTVAPARDRKGYSELGRRFLTRMIQKCVFCYGEHQGKALELKNHIDGVLPKGAPDQFKESLQFLNVEGFRELLNQEDPDLTELTRTVTAELKRWCGVSTLMKLTALDDTGLVRELDLASTRHMIKGLLLEIFFSGPCRSHPTAYYVSKKIENRGVALVLNKLAAKAAQLAHYKLLVAQAKAAKRAA